MPVTFWTFMVGTLALAGVWPLSGFYSKDSILALAADTNVALFILGLSVAMLTTFYMFRLVFVVFFGATNSEASGHAHESARVMIWPLRILAVFSVIGWIIAGLMVRGIHGTTEFIGRMLRLLQTGNLQTYAFLFALGVAFVLYLALK